MTYYIGYSALPKRESAPWFGADPDDHRIPWRWYGRLPDEPQFFFTSSDYIPMVRKEIDRLRVGENKEEVVVLTWEEALELEKLRYL